MWKKVLSEKLRTFSTSERSIENCFHTFTKGLPTLLSLTFGMAGCLDVCMDVLSSVFGLAPKAPNLCCNSVYPTKIPTTMENGCSGAHQLALEWEKFLLGVQKMAFYCLCAFDFSGLDTQFAHAPPTEPGNPPSRARFWHILSLAGGCANDTVCQWNKTITTQQKQIAPFYVIFVQFAQSIGSHHRLEEKGIEPHGPMPFLC